MQGLDQLIEFYPLAGLCIVNSVLMAVLISSLAVKKLKAEHAERISKLETNVSILTSGALGMGQKMLSLEAKYLRLSEIQEEIKLSDTEFSYTQAQKLISQGVDDVAVAANSGLSSTEINLMRLLQNQNQDHTAHSFHHV